MTMYYTRNLRPNSAVTLIVGQVDIEIPPLQPAVQIVGTCNSGCTNRIISQPMYVINAFNHMHYLGRCSVSVCVCVCVCVCRVTYIYPSAFVCVCVCVCLCVCVSCVSVHV